MNSDKQTDWLREARALSETLCRWRRDFHRHPETGNREFRTAERVETILHGMNIPTVRLTETAVMGVLRGGTQTALRRCVALRADMDALSVQEETGLPFSSEVSGMMHACGHDFHMAALLGAARLLSDHRARLAGDVRFLFQPDEEGDGGAARMIAAGCLDAYPPAGSEHAAIEPTGRVCAVFGGHVNPDLPAGTIGIRHGKFYAASNPFTVTVTGQSAHGAQPEKGRDALAAAAQMALSLRALSNRFPTGESVLSVCTLKAGTAQNVIAAHAEFSGMIRTLGQEARENMKAAFCETLETVAREYGVQIAVKLIDGYPGVVNTEPETTRAEQTARRLLGDEKVYLLDQPTMTTEDFGLYLLARAGCYLSYGVGQSAPLHHPAFSPDEAALAPAAATLAALAEQTLTE